MKAISSLPARQMTIVEVDALLTSDSIIHVRPQFVDISAEELEESVVGITLMLDQGVSLVCFNPEENVWVQLVSDETGDIESIDNQLDNVFDWMIKKYGKDGFATVED